MEFSSLRKIKALVIRLNSRPSEEDIELWFPHMYRDGNWACTIVLNRFPDTNEITPIVQLLNQEKCIWWMSEFNGDIAFVVQ